MYQYCVLLFLVYVTVCCMISMRCDRATVIHPVATTLMDACRFTERRVRRVSETDYYYLHMPIGKVWITSFTVCFLVVIFVCVCTVTDLSAEDKASGVKFSSALHRSPRHGITHFGGTLLPQKPKIERIDQRAFSAAKG